MPFDVSIAVHKNKTPISLKTMKKLTFSELFLKNNCDCITLMGLKAMLLK